MPTLPTSLPDLGIRCHDYPAAHLAFSVGQRSYLKPANHVTERGRPVRELYIRRPQIYTELFIYLISY